MHPILVLLRKDFARLRRDKAALSLTFVVPFVLIYLFGHIFGVNQAAGPSGIPLAVVNASDNPSVQRLVEALKATLRSRFRPASSMLTRPSGRLLKRTCGPSCETMLFALRW